jgi:serine/threonine protein phosphatase PrpC
MLATLMFLIVLLAVVLIGGAVLLRARRLRPLPVPRRQRTLVESGAVRTAPDFPREAGAPGGQLAERPVQALEMAPTRPLDDRGIPGSAALSQRGVLDRLRSGAAAAIAPRNTAPRNTAPRVTGPAYEFPGTRDFGATPVRELIADWPPGLAVVALATGSIGYPSPDAYFVQRNIIAVARGLNGASAGQRAATLTLSAIITAPLGRAADVGKALRDGVKSANQLVRSVAKREPENSDLATTLDVVHVAFDGEQATLCYAHAGTAAVWLQRAGTARLEPLTQAHAVDGGPVLRAVGFTADLTPDIGELPAGIGDRVFIVTATPYYVLPAAVLKSIAADHADKPLADCVTALAEAARAAAAPEGITIVAAELSRSPSFQG